MFAVELASFEGPLDLLLHLIEKEELDITAISLVQVTDQYMAVLRSGEKMEADALADFIFIGAKLLYLKSRALLPGARDPALTLAEEEVGQELTELLQEYRKFKEAAAGLRQLEERGHRAYPRLVPPNQLSLPLPHGLDNVTLESLLQLFREALARREEEEEPHGTLPPEEFTVKEKMESILSAVARQGRVGFRSLVSSCRSRLEVIVAFLALLELLRLGRLEARQERPFDDILLLDPHAVAPDAVG